METDAGVLFTKLRGAAQGTAALVAEMVVAALAEALGLRVPRRTLVVLEAGTPTEDRDQELGDLLRASVGLNLGFELLEGARDLQASEAPAVEAAFAGPVLWLDALVMNRDRTPRNPNVMVRRGERWLVDHGAALPFQYDWRSVTEDSPRAARFPLKDHLFAQHTRALTHLDDRLAARLTRAVLTAALQAVPDEFLAPLVSPPGGSLARRRSAYEAFLWKRLKAPRAFVS